MPTLRRALALSWAAPVLLPLSAGAYDPGKAPRYPSDDMYRPNMDGMILKGDSSTGNASGLCSKVPELGLCRPLSERAKDAPSILDAVGVVCDGVHDDADGIIDALNLATFMQGTMYLPGAKACAISKKVSLGRAKFVGNGTGSALIPLAAMDTMIEVMATLSAVRNISFINRNGYAKSGVVVRTINDALQTYVETSYFTGFTDFAVRHEGGQHLVLRGNGFIANYGMFASNADGINDLIVDNYSAGGRGLLFTRTSGKATEGPVVEKNVIIAQGDPKGSAKQ